MSRLCPIVILYIRMHVFDHQCVFSRRANCKSQNDVSKWFDTTYSALPPKCVELGEKGICVVTLRISREFSVWQRGKQGHTERERAREGPDHTAYAM